MKYRLVALMLALTVAPWAQTTSQTSPSTSQPGAVTTEKSKCPCCDKMADSGGKAEHSCCAREAKTADGKETGACCGGKDGKICSRGDKTAASCCKDSCGKDKMASASCGKNCGKECKKGCCASKKKMEADMHCCAHAVRG